MAFITAQDLTPVVASSIQQKPGSLSDYWLQIIKDSVTRAYNDIVTAFAARGFSLDLILQWDRGVEFNTDIGLWWSLRIGKVPEGTQRADRRDELKSLALTVGGKAQDPDLPYGQVHTVIPEGTDLGLFSLDPNDTRIGVPTRF